MPEIETYLAAIVVLLALGVSLLVGVVVSLGPDAMTSTSLVVVLVAVAGIIAYDVNRRSA
ncbi:hypothetical protein [Haladaptatus caseinilyticus]|uniref:hypothetical protein n=1 Tax=Haladaptatus caseinilyticus TaxID=2993314 RepID=UPI00224A81F9|nr:hypothetical protein [Haladaptatus caseinilyticus]